LSMLSILEEVKTRRQGSRGLSRDGNSKGHPPRNTTTDAGRQVTGPADGGGHDYAPSPGLAGRADEEALARSGVNLGGGGRFDEIRGRRVNDAIGSGTLVLA